MNKKKKKNFDVYFHCPFCGGPCELTRYRVVIERFGNLRAENSCVVSINFCLNVTKNNKEYSQSMYNWGLSKGHYPLENCSLYFNVRWKRVLLSKNTNNGAIWNIGIYRWILQWSWEECFLIQIEGPKTDRYDRPFWKGLYDIVIDVGAVFF